jgi:mRNA interferase MazF
MKEGDVVLTPLPQANGQTKIRPAILLRQMPPFGDWLVCGLSTQLRQEVVGFDEIIEPSHPDFEMSGLKAASLIRKVRDAGNSVSLELRGKRREGL